MRFLDYELRSRPMVILNALLGISKKHGKTYCWVSQERLVELAGEFGGVWMSRRTLNRDLRFLEDGGWIERIRRFRVGSDGKKVFTSTLYKFKAKVFNCLFSLGDSVKRLFLHYRVPKWVQYQLLQKQAFLDKSAASVEKLLIKERDGTILHWDRSNGALRYPSGVPY